MTVHYKTFGCKANQYDTERMRQALESAGAGPSSGLGDADLCVINTCTVTNQADADARRYIRKVRREHPHVRVLVAGCSAALKEAAYASMEEVDGVVPGHDPERITRAAAATMAEGLVQLGSRRSLDRMDVESVAGTILQRRAGATRGWLKVQDGCDRKCAFCATRLARGESRSRSPDEVVREAQALAQHHPELVITGIHIGHYGLDLNPPTSLAILVSRLLEEVPGPRFRLGSIEATEVDDLLLTLLTNSGGSLVPHLHMPLQSGADPVLRRMRRWHTREMYRARAIEIAERVHPLGLGADVITGFPGETQADHEATRSLVEEIPFTYLHVFPYSPREGTVASELDRVVPQRIAGDRSRDLRDLAHAKGTAYARGRVGSEASVVLEGNGGFALTEDYLRVMCPVTPDLDQHVVHTGVLQQEESGLRIDLARARD